MSSAAFDRFLDVMLPGGGYAVALAEVYIDESYDDQSPPILCVAGYVYRKNKAREFSKDWGNYLKRKGLPYFHMSECAHAKGVFEGRNDCDEIERELIRRTREMTVIGLASTINERDYAEFVAPREGMRSAYAMALFSVMIQVRKWSNRVNFKGEIAYFFESGHKHQNDANEFMKFLFGSQRIAEQHHYAGHAFVPKATPALHPADLLAWQWRLETKRSLQPNRKRLRRADLSALIRPHDVYMDWNRAELQRTGEDLQQNEQERARIIREALATGIMPEWPQ